MSSGSWTWTAGPVALDLTYWPDTPQEVIDEMYAIVESVTFERP